MSYPPDPVELRGDAHAFDECRHDDLVARIRAYGRDDDPRDEAYDAREAYELDDPKHPDHYETLVDMWDSREGK